MLVGQVVPIAAGTPLLRQSSGTEHAIGQPKPNWYRNGG